MECLQFRSGRPSVLHLEQAGGLRPGGTSGPAELEARGRHPVEESPWLDKGFKSSILDLERTFVRR
jgi:hypothetical protein